MRTPGPAGGSPRDETTDDEITVRGTTQLLAVVPHLLGYLPDHSLVVVVTRLQATRRGVSRGELAFTGRLDLPPPEHLGEIARMLAGPMRRLVDEGGQYLLHAFVYDPPSGPDGEVDMGYAEQLLGALGDTAGLAGVQLHDVDLVRGKGRQRRSLVAAADRVHQEWSTAPAAADVPATADLVLRGQGPVASRSVVAAAVRRRDEEACAATDEALVQLLAGPARLSQDDVLRVLGGWVVQGWPVPTAHDRAGIALLLQERLVRDALLGRWLPEAFQLRDVLDATAAAQLCEQVPAWPAQHPSAALDRLLELNRAVPEDLSAPLLTVTAFLAWVHGQGTIANEACDLALEVDPDYRMAALLRHCLAGGIRPPGARTPRARRRRKGRAA